MPDPRAVGPWLFIYATLRCLIVHHALLALDYNYLFLPSKVIKADTNIVYIYDAIGTKLKKQFTSDSNITSHYYAVVFEYDNNKALALIHTDEGVVNVTGTSYEYEYHLKDHLGSVRAAFNAAGVLKQLNDYYPFGMISASSSNGSNNKYLYNSKELQEELGLEWYDYGARFYDPQIGRWHTPDPMSEVNRKWSTYSYCKNNPIRFIDPDGMLEDDYFNEQGKYLGSDDAKTDNIKIVNQNDWDVNKKVDANNNESISHDKGASISSDNSKANLTTEASLSIYEHYNPTDLKLEANNTNTEKGGMSFIAIKKGNDESAKLEVNVEGNKKQKIADHANEVKNTFTHEDKHYNDFKSLGYEGYTSMSKPQREMRAVTTQMQSSTFTKTRLGYQQSVKDYGNTYGLFIIKSNPVIINLNQINTK